MMIENLYTCSGIPRLWILLSPRYSNQRYLKPKKSASDMYSFLSNKGEVKLINVPHIFHDPSVKSS